MADFQFYRPQVNTLERLWSQYAEAEGSKGGAFLRGLAPGLLAGIENVNKAIGRKQEQEFEAQQTDIKLAAEEKRRRQDEVAANKRLFLSMRADEDIANARNKADADRAAAERADKVIGSQALLQNSGLFPDWAQRGEVVADPQIANQMITDREQQLAKEQEDAALAAKEAKAQDARRSANSLLTRLLVNDAMTPTEARAIGARLRVADEKGVVEIVGELGSRGTELDARRQAIGDYERFTSELKELGKTGTIPQPRDQDAFGNAKYAAEAAYGKLRSAKDMAILTPEQRASIKDELQRSVSDMRRLMGRSGMQDPSFKAQIAKDYPGLEAFQGQDIAYNNGRISGTAQQMANFQRMVNDRLKDDQQFRNQLRSVGVADGFDLNLYMSNPAAVMGETATPDKKAQIDQIVKEAKDRVGQQVLGELGASVNRVPVPNGYIDVGSMDDQQRAKFTQEIKQAAVLFQQATGIAPTKSIGQQLAADLGYWDINAPALRKVEPKAKVEPKTKEAPKATQAKEAPAAQSATPVEGSRRRLSSVGDFPTNPPRGEIVRTPRVSKPTPTPERDLTSPIGVGLRIRDIIQESDQLGSVYNPIEKAVASTIRFFSQTPRAVARGTFWPSGPDERRVGYRQYIGRELAKGSPSLSLGGSAATKTATVAGAEELVRKAIQQRAFAPYETIKGAPEVGGYLDHPVYRILPPKRAQ